MQEKYVENVIVDCLKIQQFAINAKILIFAIKKIWDDCTFFIMDIALIKILKIECLINKEKKIMKEIIHLIMFLQKLLFK